MIADSIRERARLCAGRYPSVFFGIESLRRRDPGPQVSRETEIVIEGFPRSGNTFAVVAFEYAQGRSVRIAHHLHSPAQVIRAGRWGIPTLLLVRDPLDAALSLMLRDPSYSARRALRYYASFHEAVAGYREGFVLGRFEELTHDYGAIIRRVNEKFDTRFEAFDHTEQNVRQVFSRIEEAHRTRRNDKVMEEQIAIPSNIRAQLKSELKGALLAPELAPLVARAQTVYHDLLGPGTQGIAASA